MKKVMLLLMSVSLSGCYQVANQWDIERAINICGGVENIVEITILMEGTELVTCKSGRSVSLSKANIQ